MNISYKTPLPTVVIHWIMVALVCTSLLTGFRIASDSTKGSFYLLISEFLPQGSVLFWHINAGLILVCVLISYLFYLFTTGLKQRFSLLRNQHSKNVQKNPLPVFNPSRSENHALKNKHVKTINILIYWLMLVVFLGLLLTGLSQYFLFDFINIVDVEKLHRLCSWTLVILVIFHVLLQWLIGQWARLISMFFARQKYLFAGAATLIIALFCGALFYTGQTSINTILTLHKVASGPKIDGIPDDDVWQNIQPTIISTAHGENLKNTAVQVSIRAVQHNEIGYFLFEWADPTRSQKHLPLIKTIHGWKVLQTDLRGASEDYYYEDKFAVMLATDDSWAASHSIHLGKQPSAHHPASASGRGLHYTTDGSVLDLWHWKSVRTNAVSQADDNFISAPKSGAHQTPAYFERMSSGTYPLPNRYLGGLKKDPPMTWSSFDMNWETFSEEYVLPRRLPIDIDDIKHSDKLSLDSHVSDQGHWWMEYNDTVPYRAELDHYPVGTVIPGVIITEPANGDRGDVSAYGTWEDGMWRLEMKRKLVTGSQYDQPINNHTFLWVAVFDHTQTRHSYHLRPVSIRLQ